MKLNMWVYCLLINGMIIIENYKIEKNYLR